jgi:hypothetical protein
MAYQLLPSVDDLLDGQAPDAASEIKAFEVFHDLRHVAADLGMDIPCRYGCPFLAKTLNNRQNLDLKRSHKGGQSTGFLVPA